MNVSLILEDFSEKFIFVRQKEREGELTLLLFNREDSSFVFEFGKSLGVRDWFVWGSQIISVQINGIINFYNRDKDGFESVLVNDDEFFNFYLTSKNKQIVTKSTISYKNEIKFKNY